MIIQAGDLGIIFSTGTSKPGIVQRHDGKEWRDYLKDGDPVCWPLKLEQLESGRYRVRE